MIKFFAYDEDDALRQIEGIKKLVAQLQHTIMNSQFCHAHSDICTGCKFNRICYECEELDVWCANQYQYFEGTNN